MPHLTDNAVVPLTLSAFAAVGVPLAIAWARDLLAPVVTGLRRRSRRPGSHRRAVAR